jgi:hypothetical protein
MNRFLLFVYDYYYPLGGLEDCEFMSNDAGEIIERWAKTTGDRSYVFDCETGRQYDSLETFTVIVSCDLL